MLKVYADFHNADEDGFVRLNTIGTTRDLSAQGVQLRSGLELLLSDGELETPAVVSAPGSEGVWRASIDWTALGEDRAEHAA